MKIIGTLTLLKVLNVLNVQKVLDVLNVLNMPIGPIAQGPIAQGPIDDLLSNFEIAESAKIAQCAEIP